MYTYVGVGVGVCGSMYVCVHTLTLYNTRLQTGVMGSRVFLCGCGCMCMWEYVFVCVHTDIVHY